MKITEVLKKWMSVGFVFLMGLSVDAEIRVVTTTTQLTELMNRLGGDALDVHGLMGPSVDPHLYKATARDVQLMQRANIIVYNGLHLEGRLTDVMENLSDRGKKVYAVTDAIPVELLLKPEDMEGNYDPHIWFDPDLWYRVSEYLEAILIETAPELEELFLKNGAAYRAELREVQSWGQAKLATLEPADRILITSHDAYNYFGRAFGFKVVGIQGISTVSEAGLADMADMVDFIKSSEVKSMFVETSVSPATIQRVSEDSGVSIGGTLFSDAMGRPGELLETTAGNSYDVGTYRGMFKYNLETIVHGLLEGNNTHD